MARLLADEDFPSPAVAELRRRGHDVTTLLDLELSDRGLPDAGVLALAIGDRRAVVTMNRRHFIRLHEVDARHAGIIVCTVDLDFVRLATRIHAAVSGVPALDGRLVRVHRPA